MGLGGLHLRLRAALGRHRVVQILLADGVFLGQRFDTRQGGAGVGQLRFGAGQIAPGIVQRGLKRLGIELKQQLAGADEVALGVGDFVQIALHPSADFHRAGAFGLTGKFEGRRRGLRRGGNRGDFDRWRRGLLGERQRRADAEQGHEQCSGA